MKQLLIVAGYGMIVMVCGIILVGYFYAIMNRVDLLGKSLIDHWFTAQYTFLKKLGAESVPALRGPVH